MRDVRNFTLGTANLGLSYGITNSADYNENESLSILKSAISNGIESIDTSSDYGKSETLIGEIPVVRALKITTKISKRSEYKSSEILETLNASLRKLKVSKVENLLFHDPEIYQNKNLKDVTDTILQSGKVERVGFSAYNSQELIIAKENNPLWSVFQMPENILDQRSKANKDLLQMKKDGNRIYARSAFLQGLLLSEPSKLPKFALNYKSVFENFHRIALQNNTTILDLCVSYMLDLEWSYSTIIGVASTNQLTLILNSEQIKTNLTEIQTLPSDFLDPRKWPSRAK